jgi:hypothetical protein
VVLAASGNPGPPTTSNTTNTTATTVPNGVSDAQGQVDPSVAPTTTATTAAPTPTTKAPRTADPDPVFAAPTTTAPIASTPPTVATTVPPPTTLPVATPTTIPATAPPTTAAPTSTTTPPFGQTIAVDDTGSGQDDRSITVRVLQNDTFGGSIANLLTLTIVGVPSHGSAFVSGANIVYRSDHDFRGTDAFVYSICSVAGSCDQATVTMTITH